MPDDQSQIILIIVVITVVLLFIGILFLILIWSYNNKKRQMIRERQQIRDAFEKQLLQSKLEIQEETFNAISQEIHDNVGQLLSFAKIQLNIIEQRQPEGTEDLRAVKDTIGNAFTSLRNIARSLSSGRIQSISLTDNLREEAKRLERMGMEIELMVQYNEQQLPPQVKVLVFRMVQESLQNILKHANATRVCITLHYRAEELHIIVEDNGAGFDTGEALEKKEGLGLQNILNRAALIGGTASINSTPATGTSIHIIIPYA